MASLKAIYLNGEPQNLPAAALDALEWLDVFHSLYAKRLNDESRAAFERARAELRKFLQPHLPHIERTGEVT